MYPIGGGDKGEDNGEGAGGAVDEGEGGEVADEGGLGGVDMHNTSRVDVGAFIDWSTSSPASVSAAAESATRVQQLSRFPRHMEARYVECILHPGECLYIPRGWWHYVRSLSASCSVSFWWD